jgi:hypothetical protein
MPPLISIDGNIRKRTQAVHSFVLLIEDSWKTRLHFISLTW